MASAANVHPFPPRRGRGMGDTVNATLQVGSAGAAVTELKAKLNLLGLGPLDLTDATFDDATGKAVAAFQASVGIGATGVYDPATDIALNGKVLQSTGGTVRGTSADTGIAPVAPKPLWQTGLMVMGGLAIAGGILYLLTKGDESESGAGYRRALPGKTVEHDASAPARYRVGSERLKRVAGIEKCDKTPDAEAWADGEELGAL